MVIRCIKISCAIFLSFLFTFSLGKFILCLWDNYTPTDGDFTLTVDSWLEAINLGQYKQLFRQKGKNKMFVNPSDIVARNWRMINIKDIH
ncbi:hypothetical protein DMENIID0001_113750 [Sergentomyia squamirostris]